MRSSNYEQYFSPRWTQISCARNTLSQCAQSYGMRRNAILLDSISRTKGTIVEILVDVEIRAFLSHFSRTTTSTLPFTTMITSPRRLVRVPFIHAKDMHCLGRSQIHHQINEQHRIRPGPDKRARAEVPSFWRYLPIFQWEPPIF
jgi:hypothetical protein